MVAQKLSVRVTNISWEAEGVLSFEFKPADTGGLPRFAAGAHIDLFLCNGLVRSYSLANDPADENRYVVAVGLDAKSRGGSKYLHEQLRVGTVMDIGEPRNNFPLDAGAGHTVLVAGGIGITPVWCMAQTLTREGKSWELFYAARSRRCAAYATAVEQVAARSGNKVHFHFDDEKSEIPDLLGYLGKAPDDSHAYCCGPLPMLGAFEKAAAEHFESEQIHVEYFKAKEAVVTTGSFAVELRKSKKFFDVQEGKTILDGILDAGVDVPYSCMDGICGSCEVKVLDGVPDHHDSVLSPKEKALNDRMLVCCSRSKSETLVLDI